MSVSRIGRGNQYGIGESVPRQRVTLLSPRHVHSQQRRIGCSNAPTAYSNLNAKLSHNLAPVATGELTQLQPPPGCSWEEAQQILTSPMSDKPKMPKRVKVPKNVTVEERLMRSAQRAGDMSAVAHYQSILPLSVKQRLKEEKRQRGVQKRKDHEQEMHDAWQTELIERWKPPKEGPTSPVRCQSVPATPSVPSVGGQSSTREPSPTVRIAPAEQLKQSKAAQTADLKHRRMLQKFVTGAKDRGIQIERLFQELDTDGSGQLSSQEVKAAFERVGVTQTRAEALSFTDWIDEDGNGGIELCELVNKIHGKRRAGKVRNKMDQKTATQVKPGSTMSAWVISKDAAKNEVAAQQGLNCDNGPAKTAIWLGSPAGKRFDPFPDGFDFDAYQAMGDALGGITKDRITEIVKLDKLAIEFDSQRRQKEMVGALSASLDLRVKVFASTSADDVLAAARRLAMGCNAMAMEYLEVHNDIPVCLELLKKADSIIQKYASMQGIRRLRATTHNGYSCYWRRLSSKKGTSNKQKLQLLNTTRRCIEQATALEKVGGDADNASGTLINFGAILSTLGRYEEALSKADEAIFQLEEAPERGKYIGNVVQSGAMVTSQLACAYHNRGVALNCLGRSAEALVAHKAAVETSREQVGPRHLTTARVENGLIDALALQRQQPWTARGANDPELWALVTTADRSLGSGQLRPIGQTQQGPVAWDQKACEKAKTEFSVFGGMEDFAEPGRYFENLIRPHSTLGVGPPSPTLPSAHDGRAVLADTNIWDIRQKEAWRFHPTFMNSRGQEANAKS